MLILVTIQAVGKSALAANTSGERNTGLGSLCLDANTTGNYNTGAGYATLSEATTASNNTDLVMQHLEIQQQVEIIQHLVIH